MVKAAPDADLALEPICSLKTSVVNEAGEECPTGTATTYTVPLRKN